MNCLTIIAIVCFLPFIRGECDGNLQTCTCKDVYTLNYQMSTLLGQCIGGLIYGDQCFTLPDSRSKGLTFPQAKAMCESMQFSLAEISTEDMYNKVYNFLEEKYKEIEGSSNVHKWFWLGMTFQPVNNPNNDITMSDGSKVQLEHWYRYTPYKGPKYAKWINMAIGVNSAITQTGVYNNPTGSTLIPLCSYKIE